jgi:hypothetical protein
MLRCFVFPPSACRRSVGGAVESVVVTSLPSLLDFFNPALPPLVPKVREVLWERHAVLKLCFLERADASRGRRFGWRLEDRAPFETEFRLQAAFPKRFANFGNEDGSWLGLDAHALVAFPKGRAKRYNSSRNSRSPSVARSTRPRTSSADPLQNVQNPRLAQNEHSFPKLSARPVSPVHGLQRSHCAPERPRKTLHFVPKFPLALGREEHAPAHFLCGPVAKCAKSPAGAKCGIHSRNSPRAGFAPSRAPGEAFAKFPKCPRKTLHFVPKFSLAPASGPPRATTPSLHRSPETRCKM